ncbi:MAG: helical backbone metal receptor [Myxococcales bacterium]
MALRVFDDRKREVLFLRPPQRIVSLVPSDTLNVFALGAGGRLVGRTRYCVEPEEAQALPVVGGTKDVDVEAVAELHPDLVLANQEENSRAHIERLAQLQLQIFISFPRRVGEGIAHLARLARILGVESEPGVVELLRRGYRVGAHPPSSPLLRTFVPIWMEPLMTVNADTFIHDALALAGGENVFAGRARRYPLMADLRGEPANPAGERDTRYPRVTLDEVRERAPELLLLPDEPHPFSEEDAARLQRALPSARVLFCSGRDLCWYGVRSIEGIPRLRAQLAALR